MVLYDNAYSIDCQKFKTAEGKQILFYFSRKRFIAFLLIFLSDRLHSLCFCKSNFCLYWVVKFFFL